MKRSKIAFLIAGSLILCAAALILLMFLPRGKDPGEPVRRAADLLKSARRAEKTSYARALQLYEKAFSSLEKTSTDLKESLIPQIRLKAEAERSPLACAYLVSQTIGDVGSRAWALASVAAAYADAGDKERASQLLSEALQLAERMEDDYPKATHLTAIALEHAGTIERGKSTEILSRALAVAEGIGGPDWKPAVLPPREEAREETPKKTSFGARISEAVRSTKEALGISGRGPGPDEPENLADRRWNLSAENRKAIAASHISFLCTESARYEEALRAIELMSATSSRIRALCKVAEKRGQGGELEKASTLLSQAYKLAETMESDSLKPSMLERVAGTYARMGSDEKALEIAETVAEESTKAAIQAEVAECLFKAGHREKALGLLHQARSLAESLVRVSDRSMALGYVERAQLAIAEHHAAAGEYDEALRVAEGIEDASLKGEALIKVARKLAETDQKKKALETLSRAASVAPLADSDYAKESLLVELAAAHFQLGEKRKASQYVSQVVDIARKRKEDDSPYGSLGFAAYQHAEAGEYVLAVWLAGRIEDPEVKNSYLVEIAWKCLEAGKSDEALRIVKQVPTREMEDRSLLQITSVYAANRRHLEALRVAKTIADAGWKVRALAEIGRALGKSGVRTGNAERKILHEIVQELD